MMQLRFPMWPGQLIPDDRRHGLSAPSTAARIVQRQRSRSKNRVVSMVLTGQSAITQ
jgi:hypothetical protein